MSPSPTPALVPPPKQPGPASYTPAYAAEFRPAPGGTRAYAHPTEGNTDGFVYGAYACAGIATLFFPIVFGPVAIILAGIAISRNEPHGRFAMMLAVIGTVFGFILGMIVAL